MNKHRRNTTNEDRNKRSRTSVDACILSTVETVINRRWRPCGLPRGKCGNGFGAFGDERIGGLGMTLGRSEVARHG